MIIPSPCRCVRVFCKILGSEKLSEERDNYASPFQSLFASRQLWPTFYLQPRTLSFCPSLFSLTSSTPRPLPPTHALHSLLCPALHYCTTLPGPYLRVCFPLISPSASACCMPVCLLVHLFLTFNSSYSPLSLFCSRARFCHHEGPLTLTGWMTA